jgi:hypothetical protein
MRYCTSNRRQRRNVARCTSLDLLLSVSLEFLQSTSIGRSLNFYSIVIAASVTQVVFFNQTLVTSEHSRNVFGIMSFLMILVPVEGLSMTILRQPYSYLNPTTGASGCASLVPDNKFNAGPVFYLARL